MLGLVDIVTLIVLLTFLRFSFAGPDYSFSIFRTRFYATPPLRSILISSRAIPTLIEM